DLDEAGGFAAGRRAHSLPRDGDGRNAPRAGLLAGAQLADQPDAVAFRHGEVGQDHVGKNLLAHAQGLLGPGRHRHQRAGVLEDGLEKLAGIRVVFDDEDMDPDQQITRNGRLATHRARSGCKNIAARGRGGPPGYSVSSLTARQRPNASMGSARYASIPYACASTASPAGPTPTTGILPPCSGRIARSARTSAHEASPGKRTTTTSADGVVSRSKDNASSPVATSRTHASQ